MSAETIVDQKQEEKTVAKPIDEAKREKQKQNLAKARQAKKEKEEARKVEEKSKLSATLDKKPVKNKQCKPESKSENNNNDTDSDDEDETIIYYKPPADDPEKKQKKEFNNKMLKEIYDLLVEQMEAKKVKAGKKQSMITNPIAKHYKNEINKAPPLNVLWD